MSYKFHEDTECAHKTCLMMKQCHESLFLPFLFKVNTSGSYLDLQLKCKAYIPLRRKILASGVGVGQLPRRQTFALGIPTCWYLLALPPMPIPDANPKICVTPDANPRCQSVEYRWRWAFWRWAWHWACTFHVVYVNFICVGHPTQTRFLVKYGLNNHNENIKALIQTRRNL